MTLPPADGFDEMEMQFTPPYTQPAVSVRATWPQPDETGRPAELIVEWKEAPPSREVIALTLAIARSGGKAGVTRASGAIREAGRALEASQELIPEGECGAKGEAHEDIGHWCVLPTAHDPVEVGGRAHRCSCGGIFAAFAEVPDVPGRASRNNRRDNR